MLYVTASIVGVFQSNWNEFLLTLEEATPVAAEQLSPSVDVNSITSISLTSADDKTLVTLADYFDHSKSYRFLVVVLIRHFA